MGLQITGLFKTKRRDLQYSVKHIEFLCLFFMYIPDKDIDQVWEKMTDSEKQQFHKAVTSGHLGSLLSVHIPWWDVSYSILLFYHTCKTQRTMVLYHSEKIIDIIFI